MIGSPAAGYRLMIVDDDELTREALRVLAEGAGFAVEAWESGIAALEALAGKGEVPQGVLADVRMPGPSGETFARLARAACGEGTAVVAMSATHVGAEELRGYDGFLLKPFSMEEMWAALAGAGNAAAREAGEAGVALRAETFMQLGRVMGGERRRELYRVCVADAEARIHTLREAAAAGDEEGWRGAAHTLKGPFAEMTAALERLRRILDAQLP